ncbi:hypothetical protein Lmor_0999 [Legionella moravica]|uniref:Uncharacterized protein n=1 Tax=Legionella moravica TaxID=39962 RepID=A0A378JXD7_9GAMM|nr:hypothetical protein [Legionella moravica]KTD35552.1 hypothetical protein Lmor_0999 [Legionella moravica]STX62700.1 Uncharacterised protein [Legionella moravica]
MHRMFHFFLISLLMVSTIQCVNATSEPSTPHSILRELNEFSSLLNTSDWKSQKINQEHLPAPYNDLLTQQLLTPALENYYKRKAIIRVIQAHQNPGSHTYSRMITMLLDSNKQRNDPQMAQELNESLIAELAFITIYFKELPQELVGEITRSNIPFGTLLKKYGIIATSTNRYYFKSQCNPELARTIQCSVNSTIYGRINTLVRVDNHRVIARVIELLSGIRCQNRGCDVILKDNRQ